MNTKFDPNVMAQLLVAADMPIERPELWTEIQFTEGRTTKVSPQIARSVIHVNRSRTNPGEDRIAFQEAISKSYSSLIGALKKWGSY